MFYDFGSVDGDADTRWVSLREKDNASLDKNQWIQVDLAQKCDLHKVVLKWEGERTNLQYNLQTSLDGTTWENVAYVTNGNAGNDIFMFDDGTQAVQRGESVAMETMTQLIKEETESYILGKAAALGQTISVDVRVGDGQPPVPMEVTICGSVTPYARKRLSTCLLQDLGIAEENQIWIS